MKQLEVMNFSSLTGKSFQNQRKYMAQKHVIDYIKDTFRSL